MIWDLKSCAETEQGVAQAIIRCVIDFKRDPWPKVSDNAKDLVKRMLDPDPKHRLTAQEVLGNISCFFHQMFNVWHLIWTHWPFGLAYRVLSYKCTKQLSFRDKILVISNLKVWCKSMPDLLVRTYRRGMELFLIDKKRNRKVLSPQKTVHFLTPTTRKY